MFVLNKEEGNKRWFLNKTTGTEISCSMVYEDMQKNKWWVFDDLFTIPFIRQFAAKKAIDLYGVGLQLDDILIYTKEIKSILKGADAEKYEKAYSKLLELESISQSAADPIKQSLGLCTVYTLLNDERPDVYNNNDISLKMSLLSLDINAQVFFLNWWTATIEKYGIALSTISQTVSIA